MLDVKILADSRAETGTRLTTFQVTFPRFILAEVNTHRVFSRNSASSRAIPLRKQITKLESDMFIPKQWPTEQRGMSGGEPIEADSFSEAAVIVEWEKACEDAIRHAQRLSERGVHKSLCNRLLEPFMWHTAIISATDWDNFWALRTDENAQPEFRELAQEMQDQYWCAEPIELKDGEWHLPLVEATEICPPSLVRDVCLGYYDPDWGYWKQVSTGRCARVSYLTHDGVRDPSKDIELHDQLIGNGHMSPTEHQATPRPGRHGNFLDFEQYRQQIPNEADFSLAKLAGAAT